MRIGGNSIVVGSSGVQVSGSGGSIVVNNGEVIIDGEQCYPHHLVAELNEVLTGLVALYEPHAVLDATPKLDELNRRLRRVRRLLDLA